MYSLGTYSVHRTDIPYIPIEWAPRFHVLWLKQRCSPAWQVHMLPSSSCSLASHWLNILRVKILGILTVFNLVWTFAISHNECHYSIAVMGTNIFWQWHHLCLPVGIFSRLTGDRQGREWRAGVYSCTVSIRYSHCTGYLFTAYLSIKCCLSLCMAVM